MQTDQMHSDTKIPRLKAYITILALKLNASAKLSRNHYIKKLGAYCLVNWQRVPKPSAILFYIQGEQ